MKRKKVQVYFALLTIRRIKVIAKKLGTTAGGWVRQVVLQALDDQEK